MTQSNIHKEKYRRIHQLRRLTKQRRKTQICRTFETKIDMSKLSIKQKMCIRMCFIEAKWLYNDILNYSIENNIFDYKIDKTVKHYNKDRELVEDEFKYLGSQMKQGVYENVKSSIKGLSALKKKGHDVGKLKYKQRYTSINLQQYNATYRIVDKNKIKIQKIPGNIRVNGLEQILSIEGIEIANAKLIQKASGYYLAITTFVDKPTEEDKQEKPLIGIDFGCTTTLTLSNGEKVNCSIEESKRLKNLQRKLSKKKKGSNSYYRLRQQLRREYERISNRKNDTSNKITSYLTNNYKVVTQDEQLSNWHKGKWTSATVQHSILGRVKYKLMLCPDTVVLSKWFPTTKLCSCCGRRLELGLGDRQFVCECGVNEDRDIHAANNMIYIYNKIIGTGHTELLDRSKRDDKKALNEISKLL